jgi:hypothetical protein
MSLNTVTVTLLQTAKSQLELMIQMASSSSDSKSLIVMGEAFRQTVGAAIKLYAIQPADSWPNYEVQVPEVPEVPEAQAEAASVPEVPEAQAEAASVSKSWSVHDCHTYHKKGEWVATAIADGQYGIGVAPTFGSKDSSNEKVMGPLGEVTVSKLRWKHAKDISVGDTLFMGDTHGKKVYKGLVTGQPVAGPFCPLSSSDNSFRLKFGAGPSGCYDNEVELTFNVSWEQVGSLTDEWKDYLGTKRRLTVSPLKDAPPA